MDFKTIALAVILAVQTLVGCAPSQETTDTAETTIIEEQQEEAMTYLSNTYYKLTQEKKLSVAFIGGSVTDGYGSTDQGTKSWAYLLTKRLKADYPDAKISSTKLSIGGTGSYLSNFRYEREIFPSKPDLLFIEFAVNDKYDGMGYDKVVRSAESILRQGYAKNPNLDVIFVGTYDSGDGTSLYTELKGHKEVAEHYGLVFIKLSDEMEKHIKETGGNRSMFFTDGVHPNDAGYAYYAEIIYNRINECFADKKAPEALTEKVLPETLAENPMVNARMIYANEIDLKDAVGFKYQNSNFSWLGNRYNGRVLGSGVGSKLTFEFEGTDFGICYGIGSTMGTFKCTIDGEKTVTIDANKSSANPKGKPIAWNLPYGKHTVEIEIVGGATNNEMEIGAFLVN